LAIKPFKVKSFLLYKCLTIGILYHKADLIITLSKGVANTMLNYGFLNKKVINIYNIFDIDSHLKLSEVNISHNYGDLYEESFIFISIGRLIFSKGHFHLLKSFTKVVSEHNAKLVILGEGILENYLKKIVKILNLEDNVFFLGVIPNVFPYLKRADCFVFSSLWEGFGRVIVEALSMDLPVISSDCKYGPREILCPELDLSDSVEYPYYGTYGILTEPFNSDNSYKTSFSRQEKLFAKLMINMIKKPNLRKKYSKGLSRTKDFDKKQIIKKWKDLIKKK
jgi:glycosyltransferase involved in cell wall biosynthesis